MRGEVLNFIQDFGKDRFLAQLTLGTAIYRRLAPYVWRVLDREPANNPVNCPWAYYIPGVIYRCTWWQFYDICEELYKVIVDTFKNDDPDDFAEGVNALFARENVVWRLKDGLIERQYSEEVSKTLGKTYVLLNDPRFQGVDEQFDRARRQLDKRPDPETGNCVKDAVGAMEGVAQIILGNHSVLLPKSLDTEPFKSQIHPTLRIAIEKVYAYRGDAPGAGHSQVGPSKIAVEDAEWVLMFCATTILYFANKFGIQDT